MPKKNLKCEKKRNGTCAYDKQSDCKDVKKDCRFKQRNESWIKSCLKKICNRTTLFVLLGIICIVIGITSFEPKFLIIKSLRDIAISVGATFIISVIISASYDIPSQLKDFKKVIINAYSSNEYLEQLDEEQLNKLRSDITEIIHKQDIPNMATGLILLDRKICDCLKEPYYTYYRENIVCKYDDDKKNITKSVHEEYELRNPYDGKVPKAARIGISKKIKMPKDKNPEEVFKLKSFSVQIDNDNEKPLNGYIQIKMYESKEISSYDKSIKTKANEEDNTINSNNIKNTRNDKFTIEADTSAEIDIMKILFNEKIKVKIDYEELIPIEDNHYTHRLRYPVRNYSLDYFFNDDCVSLYAQIIGTMLEQNSISTNQISDNRINVETHDWLLPRNGVVVVLSKKLN